MPCLSEQNLISTYGQNWASKLITKSGPYSSLEQCQVPCASITNRRYIGITLEANSPCSIGLITLCLTKPIQAQPTGGCRTKPIDNSPYLYQTQSPGFQPGPLSYEWSFDLRVAREGENPQSPGVVGSGWNGTNRPAVISPEDTLDIEIYAIWYGAYVSSPINLYLYAIHDSDRVGFPSILLDQKMNVSLAHPQGWVGGCEGGGSEPNGDWLSICKFDQNTGWLPYQPFKIATARIFPGIFATFI